MRNEDQQLATAALRVGQMSEQRHNSLLLRNFATTFCPVSSIYRNLTSLRFEALPSLHFWIPTRWSRSRIYHFTCWWGKIEIKKMILREKTWSWEVADIRWKVNRTQTWHRKSSPLSAQRSTGRKFCIFGSLMLWNLNVAVVGSQEVNGQKSDNYMLGKRFHYFSLGQTLDTHSPGTIKIQAYIIFVIISPHGTFLATIFLHTKSA